MEPHPQPQQPGVAQHCWIGTASVAGGNRRSGLFPLLFCLRQACFGVTAAEGGQRAVVEHVAKVGREHGAQAVRERGHDAVQRHLAPQRRRVCAKAARSHQQMPGNPSFEGQSGIPDPVITKDHLSLGGKDACACLIEPGMLTSTQ